MTMNAMMTVKGKVMNAGKVKALANPCISLEPARMERLLNGMKKDAIMTSWEKRKMVAIKPKVTKEKEKFAIVQQTIATKIHQL